MHIHPHHMQPGEAFQRLAHVFLHFAGHLLNGLAVFHDDIKIHRGFLAAHFHFHALGDIPVAAQNFAEAAADAHAGDTVDFIGGHARDGGDHFVGVGNRSAVLQIHIHFNRKILLLLRHTNTPPSGNRSIIPDFARFGNMGTGPRKNTGARGGPYGVMRLGPRKMNMASLMGMPSSSMVSRSTPRPKPPWGGQP